VSTIALKIKESLRRPKLQLGMDRRPPCGAHLAADPLHAMALEYFFTSGTQL